MDYMTLRMGGSGAEVRQVQRMLSHLGYGLGEADGQFGVRTYRAVIAFQSESELPVDGIVAANTWVALEKRSGGGAEPEPEAMPEGLQPEPEMRPAPVPNPMPELLIPPEPTVMEPPAPPTSVPKATLPPSNRTTALPCALGASVILPEPMKEPEPESAQPPVQIIPPIDWSAVPESAAEPMPARGGVWTKVG